MNIKLKRKFVYPLFFLLILLTPAFIANFLINSYSKEKEEKSFINEISGEKEELEDHFFYPKSSDVIYMSEKIDLLLWWNKTFRYRVGFILEETENINRHQPLDIFLRFRENEHYENTERLVSFNATGNNEWSDLIPMQMWNITKYDATNFIKSCTITFIADVPASSNRTYFLYYNENLNDINQIVYNTGFSSHLSSGKLTINVGTNYEIEIEQGLSVTKFERLGYNFHSNSSLSPEKQLSVPSLKFLAHFENTVSDSTGNEPDGVISGDPFYVDGRVQYGMDFDGNDFVSYANGLEAVGDPFNGASTEFTACAWINPSSISGDATNHQTENVFLAKASDSYNDNFEIGVNNEGNIHVYIDTETDDRYADFGPAGKITTAGGWFFVAVRYINGLVEVFLKDTWYPDATTWQGATDLDEAVGSPFTIGASEHINQYFKGQIDEVAVYNKYLTNQEVEDYKYGSMPSTIQSITELENGKIFSRYKIEWATTFDMHIQDICTFYSDYNLWAINRSIYFDNDFNYTLDRMFALNTHYDLSNLNDHDRFLYLFDGNLQKDITTAGFISENYTIIHNAPDASKDALGVFIEGFEISDPVQMDITYLQGDILYDEGMVEFVPGSINDLDNSGGGEPYKLFVYFWEYLNGVNITGTLDNTGMVQYFDDTLETLRTDLNIYIYEEDSFFYTLEVNVTDIDNRLVPEATITVLNASNPAISWIQRTDENGRTVFDRLSNGTYIVNASYERYSQILTITSPQIIELNDSVVDNYGIYRLKFINVGLTSLNLSFQRFDGGFFQEYVVGANITFTIDDGSGPALLGSEYTNSIGNVMFHWNNISISGNVSLTVTWHGTQYSNLVCVDDLDPTPNDGMVTLSFDQYLETIIEVTTGDTFKSFLYVNASGVDAVILGDTLNIWVNYTYTKNGLPLYGNPIVDGTVRYDIKIGTTKINTGNLYFSESGNGRYSLLIDTTIPIELGGANWLSGVNYIMDIYATKPGYITNASSISFTLLDRPTSLSPNMSQVEGYWNDIITLDVQYTDIYADPDENLNGAIVQYYELGVTGITGSLTPYGVGGLYRLELNSSAFPKYGEYNIQISASKQNYETKSVIIPLEIFEINTRINDSAALYETFDVFVGTQQIFYFEYIVETTGTGLSNIDIKKCAWEKDIGGVVVDQGIIELNDLGNGLFELDLTTESLEIAMYSLVITLSETNYIERTAIIFLNIIPREFEIDVSDIVSVISGQALTFDISLNDRLYNNPVMNAEVSLSVGSNYFNFTDNGDGTYTVVVPDSILPDAFFYNERLTATIIIRKTNYSDTTRIIFIDVKMIEIFPGFPLFYFFMIIAALVAVVGSLLAYRAIQSARIPTFVKRVKEMKSIIKSKKSVSESLLYPSKEEYIVKRVGDKWETLGLSLADILGVERKKGKRIEPSEFEGGAA
ncbi:MAG: LamG-like jellyroll fold domain-containing protein [Promethearchaeota archaeon]